MKIETWNPKMTDKETANLAYWERNVLALYFADGWYNDDVVLNGHEPNNGKKTPRYNGWRRVLSLVNGTITFHIPDDFDVGTTIEIKPNWDGHTTEEKWQRILADRGVKP